MWLSTRNSSHQSLSTMAYQEFLLDCRKINWLRLSFNDLYLFYKVFCWFTETISVSIGDADDLLQLIGIWKMFHKRQNLKHYRS